MRRRRGEIKRRNPQWRDTLACIPLYCPHTGEIKRRNPQWRDAITEGKKGRLSFLATQDHTAHGLNGKLATKPQNVHEWFV
jgi:hypothetical protein